MARVFDPYLIPGTNVLRNLVGATDEDALAAAENDLCSARAAILRENLPPAVLLQCLFDRFGSVFP